jgi:hypothetical protein
MREPWSTAHALLARVQEPTREQALEISPELSEIYSRWRAVKTFSPTVKLGERLLRLMVLVGLHKSQESRKESP